MERSTALLRLPLSTSLRPSTSPSTRSLLRLHPLASRSSPSSSTHSRRTISTTSHLRPQSCGRFSTLSPSLRSRCSAFSTSSSHRALTEPLSPSPEPQSSSPTDPPSPERRDVPAYEITFTCKPCLTRATHKISKQGYHYGTVLITCPSCKARHLISDHLKIFEDKSTTIEDILRQKGDALKKGTLGDQGDMEFWEDGSVTTRREGEVEAGGQDGRKEADTKQLS